jgi:hypothetical protein
MSIIGAAALFPRNVTASSPFSGSSDTLPASTNPSRARWGHHDHRDPATRIDLSDRVKGILARASNDQDAADRLEAFVEAHHWDGSAQASSSSDRGSSTDVNQAFEQLSQGADASSLPDRLFGTTGESSGFSNLEAHVAAQVYRRGNKEYITFSESQVAETSVTASSDTSAVSATSAATHNRSVTFAIDFKTGAISIAASESTSVSTAVRIEQPTSSFSTVA